MITDGSPNPPPANGRGQPSRRRRAAMKVSDRPSVRRVRRMSEWGKQKYAGSSAEYLWHRLDSIDFINRGMLFAATLLLCFIPFMIVADALAGRSTVTELVRRLGLNQQAAAEVGHLFASPAATAAAVVGPRRWCSSCWAGSPSPPRCKNCTSGPLTSTGGG
jgi:hypothetical protein